LPWFIGHSFQSCYPADWQKSNVGRVDPEIFRGNGVTEFMQNDTEKKQEDKENAPQRHS
jgi:hypothetical protein